MSCVLFENSQRTLLLLIALVIIKHLKMMTSSTNNPMHTEEINENIVTSSKSNKLSKQPSSAYMASKGINISNRSSSKGSDSSEEAFKMKLHLEKLSQHGIVKRRYLISTVILVAVSLLGYILGGILVSQNQNGNIMFVIGTLAILCSFVTAYHFAGHYYSW